MLIPYPLIAGATFPGIVVHESSKKLFCDLAGVPVYQACYYQAGNSAGYVVHANARTWQSAFWICVGPMLVGSLLCILLTFPFVVQVIRLGDIHAGVFFYLLAWIGLSIGMHAIPHAYEVKKFINTVKVLRGKSIIYYLLAPFAMLLRFISVMRMVWVDLFYAVLLSMLIPYLLT